MVVVFGDEGGQIDEAHSHTQALVQRLSRENLRTHSGQQLHQVHSGLAKENQQVDDIPAIVIGVFRPSIRHVRRSQDLFASDHLLHPMGPESLHVGQMPHVLLDRPALTRPFRQRRCRKAPDALLEPRRRPP